MAFEHAIPVDTGLSADDLAMCMIEDVQEVFGTMVGTTDLHHLPEKIDPISHFEDCVTAMVGLAGRYNGVVSLHTPQSLARGITSDMLGMDVAEVNDDIGDALGEIANMIAGSFKNRLSSSGTDIRLSTPSVVWGKEYFVTQVAAGDLFTLRFETAGESFVVSAMLKEGNEA